jgi:hypothetical protein
MSCLTPYRIFTVQCELILKQSSGACVSMAAILGAILDLCKLSLLPPLRFLLLLVCHSRDLIEKYGHKIKYVAICLKSTRFMPGLQAKELFYCGKLYELENMHPVETSTNG